MSRDPHRSDRVGPRAARWVGVGVAIGPLMGAAVGAVVGVAAFDPGSPGMWGSIVAGAILGALGGGLWGALLSLGPPAPEDDPLSRETEHEWTVEDEPASGPGRTGSNALGPPERTR